MPASRISDTMKADHRELRDNYMKILEAQDDDSKTAWGNMFTWNLARYTVAEELVVYPALENHMDHGQVIADKDRNQNQEIKNLLYDFQSMRGGDSRFRPTLDAIMDNLNLHIEQEEDEDLPSLEAVIDDSESEALSNRFERTKVLMPTRAHPSAPTQPFFESAVSLMESPIDKVADIMRRFPE
nr:hypothetical protein FQN57_007544 [Myotisia sp. PD_48]